MNKTPLGSVDGAVLAGSRGRGHGLVADIVTGQGRGPREPEQQFLAAHDAAQQQHRQNDDHQADEQLCRLISLFHLFLSFLRLNGCGSPGDDLAGALLGALAALGTVLVIDLGHVPFHVDGVVFALLHAQGAADAAGGADLLDQGSLVLVPALDHHMLRFRDELDEPLGAGLHAEPAGHTLTGVHLSYTTS